MTHFHNSPKSIKLVTTLAWQPSSYIHRADKGFDSKLEPSQIMNTSRRKNMYTYICEEKYC
jgi:hypothetical protein